MSISGRLSDVGPAEVMQFIHFGSRTGTLRFEHRQSRAMFRFENGRLVSAGGLDADHLGETLLELDLIETESLQIALELQRGPQRHRLLGDILVHIGATDEASLKKVAQHAIRKRIREVLPWNQGTFQFMLHDALKQDYEEDPTAEILPKADLDTQAILLETVHNIDEDEEPSLAAFDDSSAPPVPYDGLDPSFDAELTASAKPSIHSRQVEEDPLEDLLAVLGKPGPAAINEHDELELAHVPLQLVSNDPEFVFELSEYLRNRGFSVKHRTLRSAQTDMPASPPPIALLDLRFGDAGDLLKRIHNARPDAAVIGMCDDDSVQALRGFASGAIAIIPPHFETIASCATNVAEMARARLPRAELFTVQKSLATLRRISQEVRYGALSTNAVLVLMNLVSESLERGVLFLVQDGSLRPLGGFGYTTHGEARPLNQVLRDTQIERRESKVLEEIFRTRSAMLVDAASTPGQLLETLGRPRNDHGILIPVPGVEDIILVIYADNGPVDRSISEVELLGMAADQIGVAIENEFLRRRLHVS